MRRGARVKAEFRTRPVFVKQRVVNVCPLQRMALFRACSNPQATLKLEAAHRKRAETLGSGVSARKPAAPMTLRRGAIREAVIEVLTQADDALAPHEICRRAARQLGRAVGRHTIDTCLAKVVADPTTPIARVKPGRYGLADETELAPLDPKVEPMLAVLRGSARPMRPAEIWAAIESETCESTSYDAVAGVLSRAAKHPEVPIERVKRGWYRLAGCAANRASS